VHVSADDDEYDIAIVGLGPVGALTANLCGALGLRTLVLERGHEPYLLPRAIHMDAEAMRIFQSVGLADAIAPLTRPLGGSVYLGCDGHPIRIFRSRDTRASLGWPASNLFYQPHLEAALRQGLERFPNVTVRSGRNFESLQASAASVQIRTRGDDGAATDQTARYLLACDGASSSVRKNLGVALDDMGFEERWLVIDAMVDGPMRWPDAYKAPAEVRDGQYSLMVCDPARPATLIPGAGRHRRWEYMLLPQESDAAMLEEARIRTLLASWIDPGDVEIVRAAVYRFHGLVAREWRRGRVFLLGDAAHQTPPFFGQGMCHGLRDAAQLVWKLRLVLDGVADEAMLDSYQQEREPHVRSIIAASLKAGAAVCILDPQAAALRDAQFRAEAEMRGSKDVAMTDVVPPLQAGILDTATGGGRVPQPAIVTTRGVERLDDLLGGRFTLLTLDPVAALDPALAEAWGEVDGQTIAVADNEVLQSWFDADRTRWAIVRPDRYAFAKGTHAADAVAAIELLLHQLRPRPPARRQTQEIYAP
jgi:3-(3-hydroxy-phenyl)propionate hydroxylase